MKDLVLIERLVGNPIRELHFNGKVVERLGLSLYFGGHSSLLLCVL